jgi:hypothetical protein
MTVFSDNKCHFIPAISSHCHLLSAFIYRGTVGTFGGKYVQTQGLKATTEGLILHPRQRYFKVLPELNDIVSMIVNYEGSSEYIDQFLSKTGPVQTKAVAPR